MPCDWPHDHERHTSTGHSRNLDTGHLCQARTVDQRSVFSGRALRLPARLQPRFSSKLANDEKQPPRFWLGSYTSRQVFCRCTIGTNLEPFRYNGIVSLYHSASLEKQKLIVQSRSCGELINSVFFPLTFCNGILCINLLLAYQHPPRGGVWTLRDCLVAPLTIHLAPLGGSR